jgi:hypothetical protein
MTHELLDRYRGDAGMLSQQCPPIGTRHGPSRRYTQTPTDIPNRDCVHFNWSEQSSLPGEHAKGY